MPTRRVAVGLGLAISVMGVFAGCGSSTSASSPPTTTTACRPAHPPEYPTTDAALDDADAGGTWCVSVGQTLTVTLHGPVAQSRWAPVTSSDPTVLMPVSNGVVTLVRGVTATFFAVRKPGTVTLSSTRPASKEWRATVVARS
jgi:hypothetical protein